jgi:hypothetical protein
MNDIQLVKEAKDQIDTDLDALVKRMEEFADTPDDKRESTDTKAPEVQVQG